MDDLSRLLAERACEQLVMTYAKLIDFDKAEQVADLFIPNGVWESDKSQKVGGDGIRKDFGIRQRKIPRVSRHVCTNISITVISDEEAIGLTYFTLYRDKVSSKSKFARSSAPTMVGEYHDRFVLTEAGWRFASRKVKTTFLKLKRAKPRPRKSSPK
jgi:hypothetical protein